MKRLLSILSVTVLLAVSVFAFASCGAPNSDVNLAKSALESDGYLVVDGASSASKYGFVGLVSSLHATKGFESVSIFYFADDDSAEAAYDLMKTTEKNNEVENNKNGIVAPDIEIEMGCSDNVVWIGTPLAVEASQ